MTPLQEQVKAFMAGLGFKLVMVEFMDGEYWYNRKLDLSMYPNQTAFLYNQSIRARIAELEKAKGMLCAEPVGETYYLKRLAELHNLLGE